MTQSLCRGVAVRGWKVGSRPGEGGRAPPWWPPEWGFWEAGKTGAGAAGGIPIGVGDVGVLEVGPLRGSLVRLGLRTRPFEGEERTSLPNDWQLLPGGLSHDSRPLESLLVGLSRSESRRVCRPLDCLLTGSSGLASNECWQSRSSSSCQD